MKNSSLRGSGPSLPRFGIGLWFSRFFRQTSGNFSMISAFLALPILLAVGTSVDIGYALSVKTKLQNDLDAALLATAKDMVNLDSGQIRSMLFKAISAQHSNDGVTYLINEDDVVIDTANNSISATVHTEVPTSFMRIINKNSVNLAVAASVMGPSTSYVDVNIVLDKSSSMLLAADSAGQTAMQSSKANCVFACHTVEGGPWAYNGASYKTNYELSKAMGVKLRADVAVSAAKEVLTMIAATDPRGSRIRVGLYTIGSKATQVLAPTFSVSTARTALDDNSKKLNSATSEDTSRFDSTVTALGNLIGTAGDGKSSATPLKLVLILTDGIISQRDWVLNGVWWDSQGKMHAGSDWYKVAPLNPSWCGGMKTSKVTVGMLYTEYLAIPADQGYLHTVGDTMNSASWKSTWGGTIRAGVSSSTSRRDYIAKALEDCASSPDLFIAASSSAQIEQGLSSLFKSYIGLMRLTM